MKVKALVSFAGQVTMAPGEVKDIKDKKVVKELLSAGYVEEIKKEQATTSGVTTDEN